MSAKVELQATSIKENTVEKADSQDPEDQQATQPIILHFLQEASKLAAPSNSSLVDATFDTVKGKAKDIDACGSSVSYSQHSCTQNVSYDGVKNTVGSDMYTTHIGPNLQGSNPWEVMSLINLQCEKLLHHRERGELDSNSTSSATSKSSHYPSPSESDTASQDCGNLKCSPRTSVRHYNPSSPSKVETSCITPTADITSDSRKRCSEVFNNCPVQQCTKDYNISSFPESQPVRKSYAGRPDTVDAAHRAAMEVKLSLITGLEWDAKVSQEGSICAERDGLVTASADKGLPKTCHSKAPDDALGHTRRPSHDSDMVVCVAYNSLNSVSQLTTGSAVTLDFNSNLLLSLDPLSDSQTFPPMPQQPVWSGIDGKERSQKRIQESGKAAARCRECKKDPLEEGASPVAQPLHSNSMREANPTAPRQCATSPRAALPTEEDIRSPAAFQRCPNASSLCGAKTRRKQPHPTRSVDDNDPKFQGVMFRMHSELDDSREQCQLLITSKYRRKPRFRTRSSQSSLITSSSDEEPDLPVNVSKSKVCASCCTTKTPMWRDAEDGTPLCNACGIRYKKYRVRCINCWHIPRKEGNTNSCCLKCGNFVRLVSAQMHSAW